MPWKPEYKRSPWLPAKPKYEGSVERQEAKKFYNTREWKQTRAAYRREHPLCEECERNGRTTAMYYVDHITPIRLGGDRLRWDNLQSLCKPCHHTKSSLEAKEYKQRG
jgi:5-methylcytosine-specific restriction protein A